MDTASLLKNSEPFLDYVTSWEASLPSVELEQVIPESARAALLSVDVINGFCHFGPLASPRVRDIIPPIVRLMQRAHAAGVRHFILTQDTHEPDAVEFGQYPPHCVRGTAEAEAVPEFRALPFYKDMLTFPKNSIHSALNTGLEAWLAAHPEVDTFLVVGDCTDLCTYQLAMHLRLRANAQQLRQRVILPVDCVDTYDLPVETARQIGALPHAGDLLHLMFLYSMKLNGMEVVRTIK
jgi:nicotinamidase-related amidase